MLTMRTLEHVRRTGDVKGFRACPASTGVPVVAAEMRRLLRAEALSAARERRRRWLAAQWQAHQQRADSRRRGLRRAE